jgi:hypothetical protein
MHNFPNMSYCAFENTSRAMDQLAYMLEEAIREGEPLNLNQYEERAYYELYDKCQSLMDLLEQHENLKATRT